MYTCKSRRLPKGKEILSSKIGTPDYCLEISAGGLGLSLLTACPLSILPEQKNSNFIWDYNASRSQFLVRCSHEKM